MKNERERKIRAVAAPMSFGQKIQFYFLDRLGETYSAADHLCMRTYGEEETTPSFCTLESDQAQILMDDLWNCGLRPSEGSGSAGAMKAVQDHLADMKKIAFHAVKIEP